MDRGSFPKGLSDSPEFDVHGTSESRVEKQIPTRMIVVVVDFVSTPIPVPATRNVIIGYDPGGAVVKDDTAHARFIGANDIDPAHMVVATVRIVIPPVEMGIMGIVPTPVPTVVVAVPVVIIAVVLVPTFVPAVVVVVIVVAVSLRRSETQASR